MEARQRSARVHADGAVCLRLRTGENRPGGARPHARPLSTTAGSRRGLGSAPPTRALGSLRTECLEKRGPCCHDVAPRSEDCSRFYLPSQRSRPAALSAHDSRTWLLACPVHRIVRAFAESDGASILYARMLAASAPAWSAAPPDRRRPARVFPGTLSRPGAARIRPAASGVRGLRRRRAASLRKSGRCCCSAARIRGDEY